MCVHARTMVVFVCGYTCQPWISETKFVESMLSFYHVNPRDWTQPWQQEPLLTEPSPRTLFTNDRQGICGKWLCYEPYAQDLCTHTHKFLLPWEILCHPKPLFPCLRTRSTLSSSSTSFHCRVALHCSNTSLSITDILVGWMLPHVLTTFPADQGW